LGFFLDYINHISFRKEVPRNVRKEKVGWEPTGGTVIGNTEGITAEQVVLKLDGAEILRSQGQMVNKVAVDRRPGSLP
jgi:hypothetical protein